MRIGFIGAGKVGTAFGIYLYGKGCNISGYHNIPDSTAKTAALLTSSTVYSTPAELAVNSDMVIITTTDQHIKSVCDALSADNILQSEQLVAHMSGALSSEVLSGAREKGCYVCSLHPIQSFADPLQAAQALNHTVFGLEGDEKALEHVKALLSDTGNRYLMISPEQKVLYHAAACVFSNYLVTLIDQGLDMLTAIGIDRDRGFEAMLPLIKGTVSNIENLGTHNALTGPIARGDSDTISRHLLSLHQTAPEKADFYIFMAKKTLEIAKSSKITDISKIMDTEAVLAQLHKDIDRR